MALSSEWINPLICPVAPVNNLGNSEKQLRKGIVSSQAKGIYRMSSFLLILKCKLKALTSFCKSVDFYFIKDPGVNVNEN